MKKYKYTVIIWALMICCLHSQTPDDGNRLLSIDENLKVKATLIHSESFDYSLRNWIVEQMPGGKVFLSDSKLEINDSAGCTIWYYNKLKGPVLIEYDTYIIDNGGPFDRVSDMNCFWMAKDMQNPNNLFAESKQRGGKFSNYDGLRLYYIGVGGHNNTKTRFRRYTGDGDRPLLEEHDFSDQAYLLEPNKVYHIQIVVYDHITQFYRNGKLFVDYRDDEPYRSGYFGLRTVNNHMTVDNFKVYRLSEVNE